MRKITSIYTLLHVNAAKSSSCVGETFRRR